MDENIKHVIKKKRGAPRKIFAKPTPESETPITEQATTQNINTMADNEFYNEVGTSKQGTTVTPPVTETVVPPTPQPEKIITVEATPVIDDGDVKSKLTIDPLIEQDVISKPYAGGLQDPANLPKGEIPQATFTMPKGVIDDSPPAQTQQIPKAEPIQPLNKDAETLTPAEKREGAKLSVEAFWGIYDKANMALGFWLQFPREKRIKMHNDDELDLNMKVKVSVDGTQITVMEFYEQYNQDITETFSTDPKLKEKLFEPMCREAEKLGLVMTDRQFIIKEIGQDIITKATQVISIKTAMNNFTKNMKEHYAKHKRDAEALAAQVREDMKSQSRMIDPDSPEGMLRIHEIHKKLREIEDGVERARRLNEEMAAQNIAAHSKNNGHHQAPQVQRPVVQQPHIQRHQPVVVQPVEEEISEHTWTEVPREEPVIETTIESTPVVESETPETQAPSTEIINYVKEVKNEEPPTNKE